MKKFHKLVETAKELTRIKDARYGLLVEWLTPVVRKEVKKKIDVHLERISSLHSNLGKDSTDEERKLVFLLQQHEMIKIKALNEDFYNSIKINDK